MAERFFLDDDDVSAAAKELRALGGRLDDLSKWLVGGLDMTRGCWGDDDIGKSFAANYLQYAGAGEAGSAAAAANADAMGENIRKLKEMFVGLDEDAARRMDKSIKFETKKD
ncbi:hypothetical protein [Amycolatopsis sp. cmx-4-54]|uniref:hypothetical protein n=1 Tax=Amycolatopsis sp. cmx-4-54 TaxID=2790936 RepID=UPI00397E3BF2